MSDNHHLSRDHLLHGKTVAIVGGGPAGLTLACLLQKRGVRTQVFERAHSTDWMSRGGSLDLHERSGQLALKRCGLFGRFEALARADAQQAKVLDRHGIVKAAFGRTEAGESKPEIDRGDLQTLLHQALEKETVRAGRMLAALVPQTDGRLALRFSDGEQTIADVVVGCDGAWSKVRPVLTDAKPIYSGVTFIETRLPDIDRRHPVISQRIGQGAILALGDNKGLLAQRNGDGGVRLYVAHRISEHWARDGAVDFRDAAAVRAQLLSWFDDWTPSLRDMLRHSENHFQPWPLYVLRDEQRWKDVAGVALVGDAAHVMPPFSGQGANMAMLDAVELADHLIDGRFGSIDAAIGAFHRSMLERMKPIIDETMATQALMFASDAPRRLVELINGGS